MYGHHILAKVRIKAAGRPGGSVGNLETFWRWDVSSNLGVVTRTGIMPNKWRTMKSLVYKVRLHGRRGKGTVESFSREKLTLLVLLYRSDDGYFFLLDNPVLLALFYVGQPP